MVQEMLLQPKVARLLNANDFGLGELREALEQVTP